jgi:predicted CXXCH cytochrome family protein
VRARIRFLTLGAGGAVESRERLFEGEALTLGRATDRTLHLRDSRTQLDHARIRRVGTRLLITCRPPAQVVVNGTLCRDATLAPGDVVEIGANVLRIESPPPDIDLAFTFELAASADAGAAARESPKLTLRDLGLRRRPWAWAGFIATLALGLVVPWMAGRSDYGRAALSRLALPTDRAWLSGPLHSAHAALEDGCEACHARPFQRVRDAACLECHGSNLHRHVRADHPEATRVAAERCTACHVEHDEPSRLVQTDSRLCARCHDHGDAQATDFGTDHPEFRVSLLTPADDAWTIARVALGSRAATEQSNLVFPHDVHLDPQGVRGPDGDQVMACADCHAPEPGGARFQPIRMESHCAACHRLDFDPTAPERSVPHGPPAAVLQFLVDHYSARYLAGYPDAGAAAAPARVAALPAQALSRAARERILGTARTRAALVARDLFERRTCAECHQVIRSGEGAAATWHVAPVRLTEAFMPHAAFSHASHGTTMTPCGTCHAAETSTSATDVLMPGIAVCRDCHATSGRIAGGAAAVPSDCTLCHGFHSDDAPRWSDIASAAGVVR